MSKLHNWAVKQYAAWQSRDEEGQGLAEYGLILALIAVVCLTALTTLGTGLNTQITAVATAL